MVLFYSDVINTELLVSASCKILLGEHAMTMTAHGEDNDDGTHWQRQQRHAMTQQWRQSGYVLRLEYFSDIPRTSGRTPDVQLRAIDATLCIIGHLAPNLGECPDVFLFRYNSNISLISCGRPTLRNGHGVFALSDNSCPTRPSGPDRKSVV